MQILLYTKDPYLPELISPARKWEFQPAESVHIAYIVNANSTI